MNMAKCHCCAGSLTFSERDNCYICDYCGTPTLLKTIDDERIQQLKERANKLFLSCDFDGAAALYQSVVSECTDDAESYWFLTLCTYGIQYVDDAKTNKKIPTCHRTLYSSILNNEDYMNAIDCADILTRTAYENAAKRIDEIQRSILDIVAKETPYDIFICYKETDDSGNRTKESDIAKDLYYKLTAEGYRTFYAPITLQEKAGEEYEPFIFAALNSVKIMFAIGFSAEHFNAPWVKNEWSRFLTRKMKNPRLMLISCYNSFLMNASDLPEALSKTQAKDLANASTNDLVMDVIKWIPKKTAVETKSSSNMAVNDLMGGNALALCKRGYVYLEDNQFEEALSYFNRSLDQNPELSKAYWGLILAKFQCRNDDELATLGSPIDELYEYKKALRFASGAEQDEYLQVSERIASKIAKTITALKKMRYEKILALRMQNEFEESYHKLDEAQSNYERLIKELHEIESSLVQCVQACKNELLPNFEAVEKNKQMAQALRDKEKKAASTTDDYYAQLLNSISRIKDDIDTICEQADEVKANSQCFKRLKDLQQKQNTTVAALEQEKNTLKNLHENLERTNRSINEIIERFEPAFSQVPMGDYKLSSSLLGIEDKTHHGSTQQFNNSVYKVVLTDTGEQKIGTITVIRQVTGLGLAEAKNLADHVPSTIVTVDSTESAEHIKERFVAIGAQVEIR